MTVPIFDILDAARTKKHRLGVESVAEVVREKGITLTPGEASELVWRANPEQSLPAFVTEFVQCLIPAEPGRILDPYAGVGALLGPVAAAVHPSEAVGVTTRSEFAGAADVLGLGGDAKWVIADPLDWLSSEDDVFDAIVCVTPFAWPRSRTSIQTPRTKTEVRDDKGNLLVLQAARRLSERGLGVFVVSPAFFAANRPASVYSVLGEFDLHVAAAFSIPPGSFSPMTSIGAYLVVIRRGAWDTLFTGELRPDAQHQQILLRNFASGEGARDVALGRYVLAAEFRGYGYVAAANRIEALAKRLGLPKRPLSEVATEFKLTKATEPPGFEHQTNSLYLPLIGRSSAVLSPSDFTLKPHNYIQVVLNQDKALAQYVAGFFDTPLGQMIRRSGESGVTIPKLTKSAAPDLPVYLPSPDEQLRAIELDTKALNLVSELTVLRDQIWARPQRLQEIERDLTQVNREERFTEWLTALPFPLASILWTYNAVRNDKDRVKHLLHFFEGFAQFLATVHLSALQDDPQLLERERTAIKQALTQQSLDLRKSTFGAWVTVFERLAKVSRSMWNGGSDDRSRIERMYHTSNSAVLDMLFSKQLIGLLQDANKVRNNWEGHGGIVGQKLAQQLHTHLATSLSKTRAILGRTWEDYVLLLPDTLRRRGTTFEHNADKLMGYGTPFEKVVVEASIPMDSEHLYLLSTGGSDPLQLLPFVKVMPSPQTAVNACYFYNRLEREGERFVSYHFEMDAEVLEPGSDVRVALSSLFDGGA